MSRIHEALKKAEQERAATQGGGTLPGFASTPVAEHLLMDHASAGSATGAAAVAADGGRRYRPHPSGWRPLPAGEGWAPYARKTGA